MARLEMRENDTISIAGDSIEDIKDLLEEFGTTEKDIEFINTIDSKLNEKVINFKKELAKLMLEIVESNIPQKLKISLMIYPLSTSIVNTFAMCPPSHSKFLRDGIITHINLKVDNDEEDKK